MRVSLAAAAMGEPETNVARLCEELGVARHRRSTCKSPRIRGAGFLNDGNTVRVASADIGATTVEKTIAQ